MKRHHARVPSGATVNIGRDALGYLQAAMDQGRGEDDFTLLYKDFEELGKSGKV